MHTRLLARYVSLLFLLLLSRVLPAQEVPQPVTNSGIYDFLDELSNDQVISINSAIKPYSRLFIAKKLQEAEEKRELLNRRQQKELDFYLMDFGKELNEKWYNGATVLWLNGKRRVEGARGQESKKRFDLFYYKDSLFSLTVNPVIGGEAFFNSSGKATHTRNGIDARAYIGHWGFYGSLRDNHEKPLLATPEYLTREEGGHIKGSTDFSEMRGGVTYSWKWGWAGLVKDGLQWGSNYNGANIFGGYNPTFVQLRLHIRPVKWFDFNYFHGWLNSMVVDSSRSFWFTSSSGNEYRKVYHQKYIAANMFTFTPLKNLDVSIGNSIVYSDINVFPAYLIPIFFFKSVDESNTSGIDDMNSQMFFDLSSRQIKHLHLYATLFIDELAVGRLFKKNEWNFFSWKAGFRLTDLPVENLSFTGEYTFTYPFTFRHYVPTLTFESNKYNLGHYLRDNSREWYFSFDYRPVRTMNIGLFFQDAVRGPDYTELGTPRVNSPPLASIQWHSTSAGIKASYQIVNDLFCWLGYTISDISGDSRWSSEYFFGNRKTLNVGLTMGF